VESQATEGRSGVFERKVVQAAEALIMRRSGTIARKNVTHGASLQLVSIRRGAWHTRCFIFPCRVSRRGYGRGQHESRNDCSAQLVRDDGLGGGVRGVRIPDPGALISLSPAHTRRGNLRRMPDGSDRAGGFREKSG
jgi:hypothetical protein